MRIIAGVFRGRRLLPPETEVTRPITDRVKQSLFDILAPELAGARVLDLFSGTGSMGLECLSRGAEHADFFESDRSALKRLRQNIETLQVEDRARVRAGDLFQWFKTERENECISDVVFLDPPYRFLRDRASELQVLAKRLTSVHLAARGIVVFRHDAADRLELPTLATYDERTYGGMTLEFLRPTKA